MRTSNSPAGLAIVSIIVPARNEEACLAECLQSLVSQVEIQSEIIVVDDGSTDRTRQIAESFSSVRVITPGPLPAGWSGKNNAVTAGAKIAQGEWLLFTDADTVHQPGSLARSLNEASEHQAALLSYSPEQQVRGFWEKAVMPVIFAELASSFKPKEVSDPCSTVAAANGQYILISREAYDAVGGHTPVATSLLEDVALAQAVKASGRKIFFRYGGDAVRTRMYRSRSQLIEGWTKNLALLFPSPRMLAAKRLGESIVITVSLSLTIAATSQGRFKIATLASAVFISLTMLFLRRISRAHFSRDANCLAFFGLPIFSYLLLRSRLAYKQGAVSWKGRSYSTAKVAGGQNHERDSETQKTSNMTRHMVRKVPAAQ